jgi:hypothetical protein
MATEPLKNLIIVDALLLQLHGSDDWDLEHGLSDRFGDWP